MTTTKTIRACECIYNWYVSMCAQILMKIFVLVNLYLMSLRLKFHKDPSFSCRDIGIIILTFCYHYFFFFCNIHQNATIFGCLLILRLTTIKRAYIHQMPYTRDDFSIKISHKEHFWEDLIENEN